MVLNQLKIQKKIQKNFFGKVYPGTKFLFLEPKIFSNFFWLQFVPGSTIENKNKNT
jgi:hypothetical protein